MIFPYTGEAMEMFHKAFPFSEYTINRVYRNPYGRYVYVNSKCYLHALVPCAEKIDGEIVGYTIEDFLLTKSGTLKLSKTFGYFKTKEGCLERIISFRG